MAYPGPQHRLFSTADLILPLNLLSFFGGFLQPSKLASRFLCALTHHPSSMAMGQKWLLQIPSVDAAQGFSTLTVAVLWVGLFFVLGAALCIVGYSTAPLVSSHWAASSTTFPTCDNQKCLQTLPKAPWGHSHSTAAHFSVLGVCKSTYIPGKLSTGVPPRCFHQGVPHTSPIRAQGQDLHLISLSIPSTWVPGDATHFVRISLFSSCLNPLHSSFCFLTNI